MMPRSVLMTLAVSVVVLIPTGMVSAAPRDDGPRGEVAGPSRPPVAPGLSNQGDRNGDRISDDFEARLRGAGAAERLAVIVTGLRSTTAQGAVGPFSVKHELPLIDGFAATLTAGQARGLSHFPGLRRIEQDGVVGILDDATNADFGAAAARADRTGLGGSGIGICVIDTGIDPAHEQVAPRTVIFKDYVNNRSLAYDDHGHGTHVAAIAAGDGVGGSNATTFVGVAPAASLYAAKVLNSSGSGSDSNVVAGIQWCHGQSGVDVISMSIGGGGGDGTDAGSVAVNKAVAEGDVVVVAAGNSGDEPGTINAPGVAIGAITVGAVSDYSAPAGTARSDAGIWLAGFSSRGPTSDRRMKPDIAAPGVTVTSAQAGTTSGYVTMSGTSMATPYVSGAVALALEASPTATPTAIKAALAATALDVGATGADNEWGAGLIDVRAFVDTLAGTSPVRTTAYPTLQHVNGTVPKTSGFVDIPIDVPAEGTGLPIAVTVTLAGGPVCSFGCLIVEWSPDIDMELREPLSGAVLATSQCTLSGLFCGIGRQETIGFRPTSAGRYVLRVYAYTVGEGGPFSADIFRGPLATSTTTPPPPPPANVAPVANAGPDQTVRVPRKKTQGTFTLDASASTDSDGTIVSYAWSEGTGWFGSGARVTLSRPLGTYTFAVTVTDNEGATGQDSVLVTVRR